ncbi:DUF2268 domain-containing protein [Lentibacillus saliphilus]|uniref:DUF2268 domain-containing protein n=1 Tax=Lentibacillus saliphilus TaxID=2737028 RepID=UPI001C30E5E1|nr:DUF2268 domain-containing putative Zn-dependent protease [Lentibacillus saliphilus]
MSIVRTDLWLKEDHYDPVKVCDRLTSYFPNASSRAIYDHLVNYGLYRSIHKKTLKHLREIDIWTIITSQFERLSKAWDGPDVPIFIFPSDEDNPHLKRDFNAKSGLSFKDKLFLFVSQHNSKEEIQALFTHEYNHVCRLKHYDKDDNFTLLDRIIMEGLAENAVREYVGENYVAKWTALYSKTELDKILNTIIVPHKDITRHDSKFEQLLYGSHFHPPMAGYCAGYHTVKSYIKASNMSWPSILKTASDKIASRHLKMS